MRQQRGKQLGADALPPISGQQRHAHFRRGVVHEAIAGRVGREQARPRRTDQLPIYLCNQRNVTRPPKIGIVAAQFRLLNDAAREWRFAVGMKIAAYSISARKGTRLGRSGG